MGGIPPMRSAANAGGVGGLPHLSRVSEKIFFSNVFFAIFSITDSCLKTLM